MRILFLIFLLSACSSPHPAQVKGGTKAQQPATQQAPQPAVQPRKRRAPAPQDQAAPAKGQGSSIEAD